MLRSFYHSFSYYNETFLAHLVVRLVVPLVAVCACPEVYVCRIQSHHAHARAHDLMQAPLSVSDRMSVLLVDLGDVQINRHSIAVILCCTYWQTLSLLAKDNSPGLLSLVTTPLGSSAGLKHYCSLSILMIHTSSYGD